MATRRRRDGDSTWKKIRKANPNGTRGIAAVAARQRPDLKQKTGQQARMVRETLPQWLRGKENNPNCKPAKYEKHFRSGDAAAADLKNNPNSKPA